MRARGKEKYPNKPKKPISAFFVFMEEFRVTFKEKNPRNKLVSVVGKAGGEKWKSMSDADKAPYIAKAENRKVEYNKSMTAYSKKKGVKSTRADDNQEEVSDKSNSVVDEESGELAVVVYCATNLRVNEPTESIARGVSVTEESCAGNSLLEQELDIGIPPDYTPKLNVDSDDLECAADLIKGFQRRLDCHTSFEGMLIKVQKISKVLTCLGVFVDGWESNTRSLLYAWRRRDRCRASPSVEQLELCKQTIDSLVRSTSSRSQHIKELEEQQRVTHEKIMINKKAKNELETEHARLSAQFRQVFKKLNENAEGLVKLEETRAQASSQRRTIS